MIAAQAYYPGRRELVQVSEWLEKSSVAAQACEAERPIRAPGFAAMRATTTTGKRWAKHEFMLEHLENKISGVKPRFDVYRSWMLQPL